VNSEGLYFDFVKSGFFKREKMSVKRVTVGALRESQSYFSYYF
jgi:hypothetical protein